MANHTETESREKQVWCVLGLDRGYDTFDDAYTRFAGRGAWSRGFDPEQL